MNRRKFLIGSVAAVVASACDSEEFTADMISPSDSDLPFDIFSVPGQHALRAFEALNRQYRGTSTAVVLGPKEELEFIAEGLNLGGFGPPESIIARAADLEFPAGYRAHLRDQFEAWIEQFRNDPQMAALLDDIGEFQLAKDMPIGEWPTGLSSIISAEELTIANNWQTGRPHDEVLLGLMPTPDWTEIPAYLEFGGWNACPLPEWHVAALRYWRDRWGARLVGLSGDVMELTVEKRPETREDAIALAREQYDYCADIVDQGVGDIAALAHYLMHSDWWYFWWD